MRQRQRQDIDMAGVDGEVETGGSNNRDDQKVALLCSLSLHRHLIFAPILFGLALVPDFFLYF